MNKSGHQPTMREAADALTAKVGEMATALQAGWYNKSLRELSDEVKAARVALALSIRRSYKATDRPKGLNDLSFEALLKRAEDRIKELGLDKGKKK